MGRISCAAFIIDVLITAMVMAHRSKSANYPLRLASTACVRGGFAFNSVDTLLQKV